MPLHILKVADEAAVIQNLTELIEKYANEALTARGVFRVGVSGGSLAKYLSTGLPLITTDFSKWKIFFCDERYVEENDPESTFGVYKAKLIPEVSLTEDNFVKINQSIPLADCASEYETKLRTIFDVNQSEIPVFDLLLLGMGPDGHTCSLFPGHRLLEEQNLLIAPIDDSPKPPPSRVTMTFPLINNARCCIFGMAGSAKADMVKRILVEQEPLPAKLVQPSNGDLYWIVDEAAGLYLKSG